MVFISQTVANLGFPRGECANPKGGGRQPTICLIFPENCMKMKKFWPREGGTRPWRPPLDPPLTKMDIILENQMLVFSPEIRSNAPMGKWWSEVGLPPHSPRTGVGNNQGNCTKDKHWWSGALQCFRARVCHMKWDYIDDEHWWSGVGLLQRLTKAKVCLTHGDYTDVFSCNLPKPSSFSKNRHGSETVYYNDRPNCQVMTSKDDEVLVVRCTKTHQSRIESGNETDEKNQGLRGNSAEQPVTIDSGWIEKYQFDIRVPQHLKKAGFYGNSSVAEYFPWKLWNYCEFITRPKTTQFLEENPFITTRSRILDVGSDSERNSAIICNSLGRLLEEYLFDVNFAEPLVKAGFYSSVARYFACKLSNYCQFITRPNTIKLPEENSSITTKSRFSDGDSNLKQNYSLERHMEKYQFDVNVTQLLPNAGFYSPDAKFFTYCQVNGETRTQERPWSPDVVSDSERNSAAQDGYNFSNVATTTSNSSCGSHQEFYTSDISRNVAPVEDPALHNPENVAISTPDTLDVSTNKSTTLGQEYFTCAASVS